MRQQKADRVKLVHIPEGHPSLRVFVAGWMVLVLYWPVINFASIQFRMDYFLDALCLGIAISKWKISRNSIRVLYLGLLFTIFMLIGTLHGASLGYPVSFSIFIGYVRPIFVIVAWLQIFDRVSYRYIVRIIPWLLVPAAFLALAQITAPTLVSNITLSWYSSDARTTANALFGVGGLGSRAVSVFESPVYAAVAFLMATIISLIAASESENRSGRFAFTLLAAVYIVAGFFTGSATFIIGFSIGCFSLVVWLASGGKFKMVLAAGIAIIVICFSVLLLPMLTGNAAFVGEIGYQMNRIASMSFLGTRFNSGNGQLSLTVASWSDYFYLGLGSTSPSYFIGDNFYLATLVRMGFLGLLLMLSFLVVVGRSCLNHGLNYRRFLGVGIIVLFAAGIGSPILWIPRFSEIISFFLAIALMRGNIGSRNNINSTDVANCHDD